MIELSPEITTLIMLGGILVAVLSGFMLAIPIAAVGLIVGYLLFGAMTIDIIYARMFELVHNSTLTAIPLFIFMGLMLERSGIANRMYDALYLWLGGLRGGLAIASVLIGTILAACVGTIGASIAMLAFLALPAMLKRGYSKGLASGSICAAGCLGILIPPSVMLVIYGPMAEISVGKLFLGAIFPGLTLSGLYCSYIGIVAFFHPHIAPAIPVKERAVSFIKKTTILATSMVPPVFLILSVLGIIFFGIAPPTEAAGVGAFAALCFAIINRGFSWQALKQVVLITMKLTSMMLLIGMCAFSFCGIFLAAGCGEVVEAAILGVPLGRWGVFVAVMFVFFILGFFLDLIGILFIMVPIISPIIPTLGFDPLWFAIMVCVNLQTSFMTPPFASAIFYLKGCAAPELGLTMGDIIRGVIPFILLVIVELGLCTAFPQLILWLPGKMIK
jgi:tripartite ATP-independent transporter DctM subunit